jgi:hypothetical protein
MANPIRWSLLAAVACVIGCSTEEPPPPPASPVSTTPPLTVTGPDSLLGMLRLGVVADGSGLLPGPLQLRAAPSDSADTLVTVTRWQDVLAEEIAYEEPAIVVWRVAHPWYLVAARDSVRGWIRIPDGATMVPLTELLKDRLAYLTGAWDGTLHSTPGAGTGVAVVGVTRDEGEASASIEETRLVGETLWVHVQVHDQSPCESDGDPKVIGDGWVKAWTGGKPTVWYYSRGC